MEFKSGNINMTTPIVKLKLDLQGAGYFWEMEKDGIGKGTGGKTPRERWVVGYKEDASSVKEKLMEDVKKVKP